MGKPVDHCPALVAETPRASVGLEFRSDPSGLEPSSTGWNNFFKLSLTLYSSLRPGNDPRLSRSLDQENNSPKRRIHRSTRTPFHVSSRTGRRSLTAQRLLRVTVGEISIPSFAPSHYYIIF